MPSLQKIDHARACLLGMAVGDALGAPLEGLVAQQIRSHYGSVIDYVDGVVAWRRRPFRWRLKGLYTDDTQQALALADTLLACGSVDPAHLVGLYLAMANPRGVFLGVHRGIGRTFKASIQDWERGKCPEETGADSAGIGAAMRIAPVALYRPDEPGDLFRRVVDASLMTHRDVRSIAGAAAVAEGIRLLIDGSPRSAGFVFRVAGLVKQAEDRLASEYADRVLGLESHRHAISASIANVETVLDLPRDRALNLINEEANRHGADPVCRRPTQGFPPALIPTCFYLLLTTESLEEALIEVVNQGGDADTAGAILGALAGAHYGLGAIPDRWREGLRNAVGIDLRARALVLGSGKGLDIPDLVETERLLTEAEAKVRDQRPPTGREGATWLRPDANTDTHPPAGEAF